MIRLNSHLKIFAKLVKIFYSCKLNFKIMKTHLQYAGNNWRILKRARFGDCSLTYEVIYGCSYRDGNLVYICYFRDLVKRKIIEVSISSSIFDISDRYFNIICSYA